MAQQKKGSAKPTPVKPQPTPEEKKEDLRYVHNTN
jgi:hypothetical protein